MLTEELSMRKKDSRKAWYGFKYNRNTEKQAYINLYGSKPKSRETQRATNMIL